jgi:ketosteroid isomerase-like protein
MTMMKKLLLLAAAAVLLPSCNKAERHNAPEATQTNTAADEQAIRGNIDRWLQLVKAKDAASIALFYAEDGAVMPPNMPIAKGRPAVEKVWASLMRTPGFDLTFTPEQVVISASGDMALDRGTYRLTTAVAGHPQTDAGKYVVVWRKVGSEWKAAADIFNSDLPTGAG